VGGAYSPSHPHHRRRASPNSTARSSAKACSTCHRNATFKTGLTFAELTRQQQDPHRQKAGAANPYTGFRVVLEIPSNPAD
jgi:hypothetical protein